MKTYIFRYTFGNQWDPDPETQGVYESSYRNYSDAAEDICREWDHDCVEYPDERSVWLLLEDDETPKHFTVNIRLERYYNACEE